MSATVHSDDAAQVESNIRTALAQGLTDMGVNMSTFAAIRATDDGNFELDSDCDADVFGQERLIAGVVVDPYTPDGNDDQEPITYENKRLLIESSSHLKDFFNSDEVWANGHAKWNGNFWHIDPEEADGFIRAALDADIEVVAPTAMYEEVLDSTKN